MGCGDNVLARAHCIKRKGSEEKVKSKNEGACSINNAKIIKVF